MKKEHIGKHCRQGDVLVIQDLSGAKHENLTPVAKESGDTVLAYGEVTGHAHRVRGGQCTELFESPGAPSPQERILHARQLSDETGKLLDELAKLTHEEHGQVEIEPGQSLVVRQTEYVRSLPPRIVAD